MNETPTHLDLFTGLGGFTLAFHAAGFRTVAFCESENRCRDFLAKAWPGIPCEMDIRKLDGRRFAGVDVITAGVPCQPASRAGKQRGKADDRWLWGEALRLVAEARPRVALFENPLGILDVGLDGILAEVESLGYEVGPIFDIPACAVGAPHLRHRLWITAWQRSELEHSTQDGRITCKPVAGNCETPHGRGTRATGNGFEGELADAAQRRQREHGRAPGHAGHADERGEVCDMEHAPTPRYPGAGEGADADSNRSHSDAQRRQRERESAVASQAGCMGDTEQERGQRRGIEAVANGTRDGSSRPALCDRSQWQHFVWLPCADGKLRRAPDDSISVVDGLHRSLLAALGNSIVPQVALEIAKAIRETLDTERGLTA